MLNSILPPKPVTDSFVTSNLGTMIILKACGFVDTHHARIINVSEGYLKLRIGHGALTRLFYNCKASHKPLEVTVNIRETIDSEDLATGKYVPPQVKHAAVDVKISPDSLGWNNQEFQDVARKVLWSLRYHFMAT